MQPLDQVQFMPQLHGHLIVQTIGIAAGGTLPGQLLEPFLGNQAILKHLGRIGISQLIKAEGTARRNLLSSRYRPGITAE